MLHWSFWRLEQTSRRGQGRGSGGDSHRRYSATQPNLKQKGVHMRSAIVLSILQYKLTYSIQRSYGVNVIRARINAIKSALNCFIDLIKPHSHEDVFQLEVFNHEIQKTIKIPNRDNHSLVTWHKSISRFDRHIANYTIAFIRQRKGIHHQHLFASKVGRVYAKNDLRIKISTTHQINSKVTFDNEIPNFFKK